VDHRKAARIAAEVVARIPAAHDHPAAVDLELDEPGIRFPEEQVVADGPASLLRELEIVIVVHVLQFRAPRLLADAIGELGGVPRLIHAHASRRR